MNIASQSSSKGKELSQRIRAISEKRLLDLFIHKNPHKRWVNSRAAASWIYETNIPDAQQISCAEALMAKFGPARTYAQNNAGLLDKKRFQQEMGDGVIYLSYVYRLSDQTSP